jgi:hypothetical protein
VGRPAVGVVVVVVDVLAVAPIDLPAKIVLGGWKEKDKRFSSVYRAAELQLQNPIEAQNKEQADVEHMAGSPPEQFIGKSQY